MQTFTAKLESISPYSQSKYLDKDLFPKIGKETDDAREKRTWQSRVHVGADGVPFAPPMSLKKSLEAASAYLGKIPGQGQATYVKRFKSGILVTDEIPLFVLDGKKERRATLDDFEGEWLFLDANGKPGGTRVKRCMPRLSRWSALATIYVIDEVIDEVVLSRALEDAGRFVGLGRFRPQCGGFYGRFRVESLEVRS